MNFDPGKEFDQHMTQLVQLLKKIIKHIPLGAMPPVSGKEMKDNGVNINFCFFNFLPMTEEEMEEIDEMLDQFGAEEERGLSSGLNSADMEFLKRNGIRF